MVCAIQLNSQVLVLAVFQALVKSTENIPLPAKPDRRENNHKIIDVGYNSPSGVVGAVLHLIELNQTTIIWMVR